MPRSPDAPRDAPGEAVGGTFCPRFAEKKHKALFFGHTPYIRLCPVNYTSGADLVTSLRRRKAKGASPTENEKEQIPSGICTKNDDFPVYCLSIVGQIEGHTGLGGEIKSTKYETVLPELVAVEENPAVKGMLVLLNTVGGDVEAGLAISELIAGMSKPTVSLVLGGGHSIGIPLAVAAKRSFIAKSATMTLHPVRFNGLVLGVSRSFTYLEKMQDRISTFITDHSRVSPRTLRELMYSSEELAGDMGSLIDGTKAVEIGLIDRLGGLSDAAAELRSMARAGELPHQAR